MRFGRRAKERLRPDRRREEFGGNENGTVASEERSALLGAAVEELDVMTDAEYDEHEAVDPTQQLLTYLGRFQRQLHRVQQGAPQSEWSDDAMHQLILGVELSLQNEWPIVVEALTDTARVLQSYEDAARANDALPFLNDAYEMLCLMVGDLIVDNVRPTVRDKWRARFAQATVEIKDAGLTLVDDEDGASARSATPEEPPVKPVKTATVIPFELPRSPHSMKKVPSELPTLDELPPLETLLGSPSELSLTSTPDKDETLAEEAPEEKASGLELFANFSGASYMDDSDEADSNIITPPDFKQPEFRPVGPSRMVVDILDQICDQLNRIENARPEQRAHFIERVSNGLSALEREALENGHERAETLCKSFNELCAVALDSQETVDPRFTDIGFAFCGVYAEAFAEDESDTVSNWQIECENLKVTWNEWARNEERAALEPEPAMEPLDDHFTESIEDDADADDDGGEDLACALETIDDESSTNEEIEETIIASLDELESKTGEEIELLAEKTPEDAALPSLDEYMTSSDEQAPRDMADDAEPSGDPEIFDAETPAEVEDAPDVLEDRDASPEPTGDAMRSNALLAEAQRAAEAGDGTGAKNLALQAAALFAKVEADKAEAHLRETERRLKESHSASETARNDVKQGEQDVLDAATAVSNSQSALGEAREETAGATQALHDVESAIADLEEQIRALQARREEELARAEDTRTRLAETQEREREAAAVLDALQRSEDEARVTLEKRRQRVSELQHASGEIETGVEDARRGLDKQKRSLADIEQTLRQMLGQTGETEDKGESTLLF